MIAGIGAFLGAWRFVAYALVAGLLVGYVKGCSDEKDRRKEFQATVKAVGQAQDKWTKERTALDKLRKEKANAETLKLRADYDALSKRLRVERARSRLVPAAPATARRPEVVTFDRAELERALRAFVEGAAGIAEEGDHHRLDLDVAKRWANP